MPASTIHSLSMSALCRKLSATALWMAFYSVCLFGSEGCSGGTLHLRVVTYEGVQAFRVRLTFEDLTTHRIIERRFGGERTRAPSTLSVAGLPCGQYRLSVTGPGLETTGSTRTLEIRQAEQWLTLAFPFENNLDYFPERQRSVKVIGCVRCPLCDTSPGWLKLVGVYSYEMRETEVKGDGTFVLDGLPPGSYIAIFTAPEHEMETLVVNLKPGMNRLQFECHNPVTHR